MGGKIVRLIIARTKEQLPEYKNRRNISVHAKTIVRGIED